MRFFKIHLKFVSVVCICIDDNIIWTMCYFLHYSVVCRVHRHVDLNVYQKTSHAVTVMHCFYERGSLVTTYSYMYNICWVHVHSITHAAGHWLRADKLNLMVKGLILSDFTLTLMTTSHCAPSTVDVMCSHRHATLDIAMVITMWSQLTA